MLACSPGSAQRSEVEDEEGHVRLGVFTASWCTASSLFYGERKQKVYSELIIKGSVQHVEFAWIKKWGRGGDGQRETEM